MPRSIRILLVEKSSTASRWLSDSLSAAGDMTIVGEAPTAAEAQQLARELSPDAVVIGGVPGNGNIDLVASIMETSAVPIVIVSSVPAADDESVRAHKAGAVAVVPTPTGDASARRRAETGLVNTVRAMSQVKVVTRRPARKGTVASEPQRSLRAVGSYDVVAIGASTGGPQALFTVLSRLPKDFPVPVLIVQHMAVGFQGSLLEWLNRAGGLPAHVPAAGEPLAAGVAYLAPDDRHMGVDHRRRIELRSSQPESNLRPSISYLFRSVRQTFGARCIAVLLTGMGRDGADETKAIRDAGGTTIAQDEASCVVYGMPKEAVLVGGVTYVREIEEMAPTLVALTARGERAKRGGEAS